MTGRPPPARKRGSRTRRASSKVSELVGRRKIYGFHNGRTYSARVRGTGEIAFRGHLYPSLTAAARAIKKTGRINGPGFWHLREQGEYVRIRNL